MMEDEILSK